MRITYGAWRATAREVHTTIVSLTQVRVGLIVYVHDWDGKLMSSRA